MIQEQFVTRHNGPREHEIAPMLHAIGVNSIDELLRETFPDSIRLTSDLDLPDGISEFEYAQKIRKIASKNKLYRTYIGMGYYNTETPAVIKRNILENPSWYTSYTPYQAEISQGRLEALLNFQTMVMDLTGMEIANASLLDEATAAAEAMIMMLNARPRAKVKAGANKIFIDQQIFPQTLDVVETKAEPLGIEVVLGDYKTFECSDDFFGALVQFPNNNGSIVDYKEFGEKLKAGGCMFAVAADLMSLVLLTPPGEWGADIVLGTTQRFGVPMGFGGPHAAYFATKDKLKRNIPGRIIGVSKDANGNHALRMALQTREQHIKRERATSNICTAQALLASMAGMYAVYHGADGLKRIATNIHELTGLLALRAEELGYKQVNTNFFDTIKLELAEGTSIEQIRSVALNKKINFRFFDENHIGISVDETTTLRDANRVIKVLASAIGLKTKKSKAVTERMYFDAKFARQSEFLTLEVFKKYRSETEMMRYIKKLERKDFSLTHSMISLGSCTMKLNAASEMLPISLPEFGGLHPFVPIDQAEGYVELIKDLESDLCEITGFSGMSLQPNSGAQGEYAGLMVIRAYHQSRGDEHRNIVLIPTSAHGTNPASAVMAGAKIVLVECDDRGNISVDDLRKKATEHRDNLSAFMVTYPSTHGVFEAEIMDMMDIIHENGGQVYMDGANLNAQLGLTSPGKIGADVCHLNLHKTFAIPHGGGGPGVGPIGVAKHLVDFLPNHPVVKMGGKKAFGSASAAPWGSASVLPISYGYIKMMGGNGLRQATEMAILNANYLRVGLQNDFKILYTGGHGMAAHEMIVDFREFKASAGLEVTDIAKRLMDYGFHAPTVAFPVAGTLMVEPTESESLSELDRFIETMKSVREEIRAIENGTVEKTNNVLKNAPHTAEVVMSDDWDRSYTRKQAAYPLKWSADNKFWPASARVDDAHGDRNLVCSCAPIDSYREELFSEASV